MTTLLRRNTILIYMTSLFKRITIWHDSPIKKKYCVIVAVVAAKYNKL